MIPSNKELASHRSLRGRGVSRSKYAPQCDYAAAGFIYSRGVHGALQKPGQEGFLTRRHGHWRPSRRTEALFKFWKTERWQLTKKDAEKRTAIWNGCKKYLQPHSSMSIFGTFQRIGKMEKKSVNRENRQSWRLFIEDKRRNVLMEDDPQRWTKTPKGWTPKQRQDQEGGKRSSSMTTKRGELFELKSKLQQCNVTMQMWSLMAFTRELLRLYHKDNKTESIMGKTKRSFSHCKLCS